MRTRSRLGRNMKHDGGGPMKKASKVLDRVHTFMMTTRRNGLQRRESERQWSMAQKWHSGYGSHP